VRKRVTTEQVGAASEYESSVFRPYAAVHTRERLAQRKRSPSRLDQCPRIRRAGARGLGPLNSGARSRRAGGVSRVAPERVAGVGRTEKATRPKEQESRKTTEPNSSNKNERTFLPTEPKTRFRRWLIRHSPGAREHRLRRDTISFAAGVAL